MGFLGMSVTTHTRVWWLLIVWCLTLWPLTVDAHKTSWEQYQRAGVQAYKQGR